jgi:radical SAM superfamily enzyme YgiQ (UPF0313 family)
MDIYLVFCPSADPAMPHAALPALGAALRDHGITDYCLRDLNLEGFLYYLSPSRVAAAREVVKRKLAAAEFGDPARARRAEVALRETEGLEERIEASIEALRSKEMFYDRRRFFQAKQDVKEACRLASLRYETVEFGKYSLYENFKYNCFEQVEEALAHEDSMMMRQFYRETVIPDIVRERPLLVGMSVAYFSQLIPSFILASEIRVLCPEVHITMGGPVAAWGRETVIRDCEGFGGLVDSFCIGEGDRCIVQLARQLKRGGPLDSVEGLVWLRDGRAMCNGGGLPDVELGSISDPDYQNIPLDNYLAPDRILSLPLTKGCYYNVCKFCNYSFIRSTPYRERPVPLVVRDIQKIVESTGEKVFSFESDVIRPEYLREFAAGLLEAGLDIRWHGVMRFEEGLEQDFFDTLAAAGCVRMYLGMESANQRLLDEMKKGISVPVIARTLRQASAAGIGTEVGVFFGYPGETVNEARDTLTFVEENRDAIDRADVGLFRLLKGAPVERELRERWGDTMEPAENFWFTVDFHDPYVQTHNEAFQDILDRACGMYPILRAMDISEEILYLAKFGKQAIRLVEEDFLRRL